VIEAVLWLSIASLCLQVLSVSLSPYWRRSRGMLHCRSRNKQMEEPMTMEAKIEGVLVDEEVTEFARTYGPFGIGPWNETPQTLGRSEPEDGHTAGVRAGHVEEARREGV
jgi:hypothetical protein